jgi:hypothetical protein
VSTYKISAVLFQRGDWWVAQCLEYDIATQAKSLPDLRYELERVLVGHAVISARLGTQPFESLPAAPQQYWEMFDRSDLEIKPKRSPFRVPGGLPHRVPTPKLRIAA